MKIEQNQQARIAVQGFMDQVDQTVTKTLLSNDHIMEGDNCWKHFSNDQHLKRWKPGSKSIAVNSVLQSDTARYGLYLSVWLAVAQPLHRSDSVLQVPPCYLYSGHTVILNSLVESWVPVICLKLYLHLRVTITTILGECNLCGLGQFSRVHYQMSSSDSYMFHTFINAQLQTYLLYYDHLSLFTFDTFIIVAYLLSRLMM